MPTSQAQLRASAKHAKENFQHISFKARIGSRDRIKEAADATGQSVNSFIKTAISDAMMKTINKPLEPTLDETAKMILLRIMNEEIIAITDPYLLIPNIVTMVRDKVECRVIDAIESNPSLCGEYSQIISSDFSPKAKGKALRNYEKKHREAIGEMISDCLDDLVQKN